MQILSAQPGPRAFNPRNLTDLGATSALLDSDLRAALAILVILAESSDMVVGSVLAHRAEVPNGRLERVVRPLLNGGLISTRRGRYGGYSLRVRPEAMRLIDVFLAIHPRFRPGWDELGLAGLGELLESWLTRHTLSHLVAQRQQRGS